MTNKKRKGIFLPLLLLSLCALFAACSSKEEKPKLILNEVMIANENNVIDDYGQKTAWIEVFNNTFKDQNIASWRIQVRIGGQEVTYKVPKGDVDTQMDKRQHVVFWADGEPNHGTFHMNAKIDSANIDSEVWIGLYNEGDKLIDQVTIPAGTLKADQSYARRGDGAKEWVVKGGEDKDNYVTPGANNITQDFNAKADGFKKNDSTGLAMAIIAMSVVFITLLSLYIAFRFIGKYFAKKKAAAAAAKSAEHAKVIIKDTAKPGSANDEVYAAIAMAMHEYQGMSVHDEEDEVLTITQVSKHWNGLID